MLCCDCDAALAGSTPIELHHPLGEANDPATISLRLSTHRFFSDRQHDWPDATLTSPRACPKLRRAAALRALADINAYFAQVVVLPKARTLEAQLDAA
jgi:hypothetical protein